MTPPCPEATGGRKAMVEFIAPETIWSYNPETISLLRHTSGHHFSVPGLTDIKPTGTARGGMGQSIPAAAVHRSAPGQRTATVPAAQSGGAEGAPEGLSAADLAWVFENLTAPAVPFDCGTKCGPTNGGLPVCCGQEVTVPSLYPEELTFLAARTDLWTRWEPLSWFDSSVSTPTPEREVLAFCKGVQHCERDDRSIACRTFPFHPFTDRGGILLGLVYNQILGTRCWLHDRQSIISTGFVGQNLAYWQLVFERLPSEVPGFIEGSTRLRRLHARTRQPLLVLRRDGIYDAPTRDGARPLQLVAALGSGRS